MPNSKKNTLRLLIIDDEKEFLSILQTHLQDMAYSIDLADNGKVGLEMAIKNKPHVIISDFHMPVLNGLEFLKSLNEKGLEIPVIWTTGFAKSELQKQAWIHGVYDIIEKPFEMQILRQCITGAIGWNLLSGTGKPTNIVTELASQELKLSIDNRNYQSLVQFCQDRNISITTYLNHLIETELTKTSIIKTSA